MRTPYYYYAPSKRKKRPSVVINAHKIRICKKRPEHDSKQPEHDS